LLSANNNETEDKKTNSKNSATENNTQIATATTANKMCNFFAHLPPLHLATLLQPQTWQGRCEGGSADSQLNGNV